MVENLLLNYLRTFDQVMLIIVWKSNEIRSGIQGLFFVANEDSPVTS